MKHIDRSQAGNAGATGLTSSAPTVAGGIPPKFRRALVESTLADCEWIRLPAPGGRCRLSSLSRTSLIELGERGDIKLIRLRKPNAIRGIVLIEKKACFLTFTACRPRDDPKEVKMKDQPNESPSSCSDGESPVPPASPMSDEARQTPLGEAWAVAYAPELEALMPVDLATVVMRIFERWPPREDEPCPLSGSSGHGSRPSRR